MSTDLAAVRRGLETIQVTRREIEHWRSTIQSVILFGVDPRNEADLTVSLIELCNYSASDDYVADHGQRPTGDVDSSPC